MTRCTMTANRGAGVEVTGMNASYVDPAQQSMRWQTCKAAGVECAGCNKSDTCTVSPDGTVFKCWRDGGRLIQTKPHNGNGKHSSDLGPIVKVYQYETAERDIWFEVTRHTPKTFRQRTP